MDKYNSKKTFTVALTGASGVCYGLRLLECLLRTGGHVNFIASQAAQMVVSMEESFKLSNNPDETRRVLLDRYGETAGKLDVYGKDQWTAPIASGSSVPDAMIICPCTSGTLSAVANGASDNLIERAADVVIKEKRQLILLVREMPLSAIHLENMLKLSKIGVTIMPASPGFYDKPETIEDLVDFVVARILDHVGVEQSLCSRWGADSGMADRVIEDRVIE